MRRRWVVLGFWALVAGPALAAETPAAGDRPFLERHGLTFDLGLTARYDDNILQLSDEDIVKLEQNPTSSQFKVDSEDDWLAIAGFDVRWTGKIFAKRQTRVHAGVDLYRYDRNDIKDWEDYQLGLNQELTATRRHELTLRLELEHVADFYLRELTDDDASFAAGFKIRESARYDQTAVSAALSKEFIEDRLTTTFGWKRARRDFVDFFEERDGVRTDWQVDARIRPAKRSKATLGLGVFTGDYAATGDLASSPIPDDDISYDHDGASIEAAFPWGKRLRGRVEAAIELERRDFTTTNPFDTFRFGRKDRRRDYGLRVVQRLGHGLELAAEWRRLSNDAHFASGAAPQDDVTDYQNNRFDVALRARIGSR